VTTFLSFGAQFRNLVFGGRKSRFLDFAG